MARWISPICARERSIAHELALELAEEIEPARTVDQLGIRDGIGRPGKQIGQADLVPHVGRNDD